MSDNLTIFGTDYTNVTGIKAHATSDSSLMAYVRPTGTKSITANGTGIDVTQYASVDVAVPTGGTPSLQAKRVSYTPSETVQTATVTADSGYDGLSSVDVSVGAISGTYVGSQVPRFTLGSDWVVAPTETQTQVMANGEYLEGGDIYVGAISSTYVGSGITRRTSSDVTISGVNVGVPAGYYESMASATVPSGVEGTPTATKGTVSNNSVSVTPKVVNSAGYILGQTKTGTAVTVSASELVSGTYTVGASGTHDVTNYASASVAAGSVSPSATKGTVSNHSIAVRPYADTSAGFVGSGRSSGSAVTVSASELVSGSQTITDNGTVDVTNLASVTVDIDFVTYYTGSSTPTSSQGSDGDIWLVV